VEKTTPPKKEIVPFPSLSFYKKDQRKNIEKVERQEKWFLEVKNLKGNVFFLILWKNNHLGFLKKHIYSISGP